MASSNSYTLTRNLKLRLDSGLTASARSNLEKLDLLGSTFLVDSTNTLKIRSSSDILIEPESADLGGSALGGVISVGTASHLISDMSIYTSSMQTSSPLGTLDQAVGGSRYLYLRYKSDISGAVDTAGDRVMSVDLQGADRTLVLQGNYSQAGGSLALTLTADSTLTLPVTGTLATLAGTEILTNKSIDATLNSITQLSNYSVATGAGIVYSKLNLTASLVDADVSPSASIAYSKLDLTDHIIDADISTSAAISRAKLALGTPSYVAIQDTAGRLSEERYLAKSRGGVGADASLIVFPAIGTLVTRDATEALTNKTIDADFNTLLNIPVSSIDLAGSIYDIDIAPSAAIQGTKIIPHFGTQDIIAYGALGLQATSSGPTTYFRADASQASDINYTLPETIPAIGQVLQAVDGAGTLTWASTGTGSVTSVALTVPSILGVTGSPITTSGTLAVSLTSQSAATVLAGPTSGGSTTPAFRALVATDIPIIPYSGLTLTGSIVNADIASGAAITYSKLALTGSILNADLAGSITYPKLILTGSIVGADISVSAAIPYSKLSLTGSIVGADIASGAAIALNKLVAITPSVALVSDSSGFVSPSAVTATELGYVSGVTSAIQTQFSGKQPLDSTLTALAAYNTNGILTQTATDTFTGRTLTAGTGISITNGDGVAGNPVISASSSDLLFAATWLSTDGAIKTVTHGLGTTDVIVQLYVIDTGETIGIDSTIRIDNNNLSLSASVAPTGSGWRVLVRP